MVLLAVGVRHFSLSLVQARQLLALETWLDKMLGRAVGVIQTHQRLTQTRAVDMVYTLAVAVETAGRPAVVRRVRSLKTWSVRRRRAGQVDDRDAEEFWLTT